ncbi:hypothetical protein C7212DRAFT_363273 [Tuber magnatum]|uniref:Uncharacterized protein n=1 Tax=Tuber magnatum TaxID=42249 RepID=A0A317STJ7_9PEZI|nr:hypothetical protein C7212DRAFT_363273 [Tuber magnatum]
MMTVLGRAGVVQHHYTKLFNGRSQGRHQYDWTPLHVAIGQKQNDIVSPLLSDAGLNIAQEADPSNETPLHIAARAGGTARLRSSSPVIPGLTSIKGTQRWNSPPLHSHARPPGNSEAPHHRPQMRPESPRLPLHLSFLYDRDSVTWLLLKLASPDIEGEGNAPPELLESERCDVIVRRFIAQQDFSFDHLRASRKEILAPEDSAFSQPIDLLPFMLS